MPLLSIIIPVFNKVDYIDDCISSVLVQTIADFELILVDDGSDDGSANKCDKFARQDPRIIVIHQANAGVSAARNAGLAIAKGAYIGFVDSDDVIDVDMYELLLNNAFIHNADISICGVRRIFPDKVQRFPGPKRLTIFNKDEALTSLMTGNILLSNYDKIFKAEIVKDIKFQPALFEDTYFNFEAFKNAFRIVFDPVLKYNYIMRDNSHSLAAFNRKYMNMLTLTKKMIEVCIAELPKQTDVARAFDFTQNVIVLNMLLCNSRKAHKKDYDQIRCNLAVHNNFYFSAKAIAWKYKWGYTLLRMSPRLYTLTLSLFSLLTGSENLYRKRAASKKQMHAVT